MISVNDLSFLVRRSVRKHAKVCKSMRKCAKHTKVRESAQKHVKALFYEQLAAVKKKLFR